MSLGQFVTLKLWVKDTLSATFPTASCTRMVLVQFFGAAEKNYLVDWMDKQLKKEKTDKPLFLKDDFHPPSGAISDRRYKDLSTYDKFKVELKQGQKLLMMDTLRATYDYMLELEKEEGTEVWIPIVKKILEDD